MGRVHFFDVEIAKQYGIKEAILLQHISYWTEKNKANETNYHDGYYWTYNSARAFSKMFPYMSTKVISNTLSKLEAEGLILTGNYNTSAYDRTKWYTLTEQAERFFAKRVNSISPNGEMESPKRGNGFPKTGRPIPDNITNNNHINTIKQIVGYLNQKADKSFRAESKQTQTHIKARLEEGFTLEDFKKVIDNKVATWKNDPKMDGFLRPQTLFGTKFESYLNEKGKIKSNKNSFNNFQNSTSYDFAELERKLLNQ